MSGMYVGITASARIESSLIMIFSQMKPPFLQRPPIKTDTNIFAKMLYLPVAYYTDKMATRSLFCQLPFFTSTPTISMLCIYLLPSLSKAIFKKINIRNLCICECVHLRNFVCAHSPPRAMPFLPVEQLNCANAPAAEDKCNYQT